jgi:hypothetical protein
MTTIFVFLFGKYNDSQDLELDNKDKNQAMNEPLLENVILSNYLHFLIFYTDTKFSS